MFQAVRATSCEQVHRATHPQDEGPPKVELGLADHELSVLGEVAFGHQVPHNEKHHAKEGRADERPNGVQDDLCTATHSHNDTVTQVHKALGVPAMKSLVVVACSEARQPTNKHSPKTHGTMGMHSRKKNTLRRPSPFGAECLGTGLQPQI